MHLSSNGLLRRGAVATGLVATTLLTVPEVRNSWGFALQLALWACLVSFGVRFARNSLAFVRGHRSTAIRVKLAVGALAVLPAPLALSLGVDPPTAWLWSVLWFLSLDRFASGLAMLVRVARLEAKPLTGVLVLFVTVLFVAATLVHLLERAEQPNFFGTLPQSLWWAVVTLTTTGYGDVVPQTTVGRVIAAGTMMSGIAVFALWAGILATGFAAEMRRQNFLATWDQIARVSFFRELGPTVIAEIARHLRHWDVPQGTTIIRRGQPGDSMYFIADGEVEVAVASPVRLGQGAFFGEMALITGAPRGATVVACTPTTLLVLDIVDFRQLCARLPELAQAIESEGERRKAQNAT